MSLHKRYDPIFKVGDFVRVKTDCGSRNRDKHGKVTKVTESYYELDNKMRVHHMNAIKHKGREQRSQRACMNKGKETRRQTIATAQVTKQAQTQDLRPQELRRQTILEVHQNNEEDVGQNLRSLTREVRGLRYEISQLRAEFDMFKSDSKRNIELKLV